MPKTKKASVLVYSLIILSVMLMIAAAFTSTSIISRKNASTTSKSSQSFQVADSGANLALKKISDAADTDSIASIYPTCLNDKVTLGSASGLRSGSTAEIVFKDENGDTLTCSDEVSKVKTVKSTGKFADTARAIEVAVAQTAGSGITGGCNITDTGSIQANFNWGEGCKTEGTNVGQSGCRSASDTTNGYTCGRIAVFGSAASCICVKN